MAGGPSVTRLIGGLHVSVLKMQGHVTWAWVRGDSATREQTNKTPRSCCP